MLGRVDIIMNRDQPTFLCVGSTYLRAALAWTGVDSPCNASDRLDLSTYRAPVWIIPPTRYLAS